MLDIQGVSKAFGGIQALEDVSFTCGAGEVHALLGENGAGKSTLIKVAAGALRADAGTVRIGGVELHRATPAAARRLGLFTAYQDTSLVGGLTVAENLLLSLRDGHRLRLGTRPDEAARLLEPYVLPFEPQDRVASLSPGSRQLLEIVRCLVHKPKVLLLDEPTAALDAANISRLESLIAAAKAGGMAIVYISHRLDEVKRLADRLTVIRSGRRSGTYASGDWDVDEIVGLMVGTSVDLAAPPKPGVPADAEVALEVAGFRGQGFGPVDMVVRRGEIVGVAGAEGNGQRELLRTIVGLRKGRGDIAVDGRIRPIKSPATAIQRGLTFQSGDRAAESVFRELSVIENATLPARGKMGPLGLITRSRQRRIFDPIATRLGIVRASDYQHAGELSGGNQQKTILARSLVRPATVRVLDEPTAGVDAKARLDIFRIVRDQANEGAAIVLGSSDSSELEALCDRVYVMSRGKVVTELTGDDVTESRIVASFVNVSGGRGAQGGDRTAEADRTAGPLSGLLVRAHAWLPLLLLLGLIVGVGAFTAARSDVFLSEANITNLLILALPLTTVAIGQQALLIVGGFDISVGSNMSLTVVLASFFVTGSTFLGVLPGLFLVILIGAVVGLLNGFMVRGLRVSPIVTTIAMLGILQGIAIVLRPTPEGTIGLGLTNFVSGQIGPVPIFFIVAAAAAIACEVGLRATRAGLVVRAVGLSEESARRSGVSVERLKIGAYVLCAVVATLAGMLLAGQVGVGYNSAAAGYALPTFTACFLGGASLRGGHGSFAGALLGALFVALLIDVTPLLELEESWSTTITGALTIVAVLGYAIVSREAGSRGSRVSGSRGSQAPADGGPGISPGMAIEKGTG